MALAVWIEDLQWQSDISAMQLIILLHVEVPHVNLLYQVGIICEVMEHGRAIYHEVTLLESAGLLDQLRLLP